MVKVKTFGVIRTTTGFGTLELEAKTVKEVFSVISEKMKKSYYIIRGWKDGAPTLRTLKRLGIKIPECAKEVYPYGKG